MTEAANGLQRAFGNPAQQQALFENTARAMGDARGSTSRRGTSGIAAADPADGEGVARALGLDHKRGAE
jgi:catalase